MMGMKGKLAMGCVRLIKDFMNSGANIMTLGTRIRTARAMMYALALGSFRSTNHLAIDLEKTMSQAIMIEFANAVDATLAMILKSPNMLGNAVKVLAPIRSG